MVVTPSPKIPAPYYEPSAVRGPVQTVGLQTKTINSFSVSQNSSGIVRAYVWGIDSAFTLITGGAVQASFLRAAGNVALQGNPVASMIGSLTGVVALVANTTAQTIELQVTGVALTTIDWYVVAYPFVK